MVNKYEQEFIEAYIRSEPGEDVHGIFLRLTGPDRQSAKEEAFRFMYKHHFLRRLVTPSEKEKEVYIAARKAGWKPR